MSDEPTVKIDDVFLSHTCLGTLRYFQDNANEAHTSDMTMLKNILVYLALPEDCANIPDQKRLKLLTDLAIFITMIDCIKAPEDSHGK